MSRIITAFSDFVLYESKIYEQSKDKKVKPGGKEKINWDFNFDSGKFLRSDIGEESLNKIKEDFKNNILKIINDPKYTGQEITINLIASTSKVPLGPNAKSALTKAGYKEQTNTGLAKARLDTLESIVNDLLFEYLASGEKDKKKFLKDIKSKVKIEKTPNPNIGDEYDSKKDNKDDEKYKDVQKISSEINITSLIIEKDRKIECDSRLTGSGVQATKENNFVGYEKGLYVITGSGNKMNIEFDPLTIPDCFVYKYDNDFKLSVFSGKYGPILVEPFVQARFDQLVQANQQGKGIKPEKKKYGNADYLVMDYKKAINEYNKDNALVNGINAKLKDMGIKGDIKSLQPKFFDREGKIEVYSNKKIEDMPTDNIYGKNVKDYIAKKIIPMPIVCDPIDVQITLTKKYMRDQLRLVVFSPCAGTVFHLNSMCGE